MKNQTPVVAGPCSTISMRHKSKYPTIKTLAERPKNKQTEPVFEVIFSHPRRLFLFPTENQESGS